MSLTSAGYGNTVPVRFEEYIFGILILILPPYLHRLLILELQVTYLN